MHARVEIVLNLSHHHIHHENHPPPPPPHANAVSNPEDQYVFIGHEAYPFAQVVGSKV